MVYPALEFQIPGKLLSTLGYYWLYMYQGKDQVYSYVKSKSVVEDKTQKHFQQLVNAISRYNIDIFQVESVYRLVVLESDISQNKYNLVKYDGSRNYDDGLLFDTPAWIADYTFAIDSEIKQVPFIVNKFSNAEVILVEGVDYSFTPGFITFRNNPFENSNFNINGIYDSFGVQTDRELVLWGFNVGLDKELIYNQFGYAIGIQEESSEDYKNLLNAIYDAITGGTALYQVVSAVASMLGIGIVKTESETVEAITKDRYYLWVITDKNVYKHPKSANATVSVGDIVYKGQTLSDVLQIVTINRGTADVYLEAISAGPGLLANCFYSGVTFRNTDVAITTEADSEGFVKITFPLDGFEKDVEKFFDELHSRGVAAASIITDDCELKIAIENNRVVRYTEDGIDYYRYKGTLAHLLDTRATSFGEPSTSDLPTTINPLEFLIENILRNNAYLIKLRIVSDMEEGKILHNLDKLRSIMPPESLMIILIDLTVDEETVESSFIDDETFTSFEGAEPVEETLDTSIIDDSTLMAYRINDR